MFVRVQCMNDVSLLCSSPPVDSEGIFHRVCLCVREIMYESICYSCLQLSLLGQIMRVCV